MRVEMTFMESDHANVTLRVTTRSKGAAARLRRSCGSQVCPRTVEGLPDCNALAPAVVRALMNPSPMSRRAFVTAGSAAAAALALGRPQPAWAQARRALAPITKPI